MIDLMQRIPLLRHSILMHYWQFKLNHQELIRIREAQ